MKLPTVWALLAPAWALYVKQDAGSGKQLMGALPARGEGSDAATGDTANHPRSAVSYTQLSGVQCCQELYNQVPKTPGNACIYVAPYYSYIGWFKGPGSACAAQCTNKYGSAYAWGVLADGTNQCDCSYGDPRLRKDKC